MLFADDTTTYDTHDNITNLNQQAAAANNNLKQWFTANKLSLNDDKTQHLLFTLKPLDTKNEPIKFLGVVLDIRLTWEAHVVSLCKKLSSKIYLIRQLKSLVSDQVLKTAYFGLFQSLLNYAILAWGHSTHSKRVFAVQRKCLRIMCGLQFRDDCRQAFVDSKILTLPCLYVLQSIMYIKANEMDYQTFPHAYSTRGKDSFVVPFHRLKRSREATHYHGLLFFNKLPNCFRVLSPAQLKKSIKDILIENAFYSIEEFLSFEFNT